jgi:hypothetical protein
VVAIVVVPTEASVDLICSVHDTVTSAAATATAALAARLMPSPPRSQRRPGAPAPPGRARNSPRGDR